MAPLRTFLLETPRHKWAVIPIIVVLLLLTGCANIPPAAGKAGRVNADLIGEKTPVVKLKSIDGDNVDINGDKFKLTVLLFFDLNCEHCIEAISSIEGTLMPVIDHNRFQFIGIGRGHNKKYLANWALDNNIRMKLVADEDRSIYDKYAERGVPRLFIIDQYGYIRVNQLGWSTRIIDRLRRWLVPRSKGQYGNV